ncbi:MAG: hypothetical protein N4A59_01175 [Marinifilum sp.]|jgi:hypothetical protein|nr:hypothetical protein [Marinifilum sp.]
MKTNYLCPNCRGILNVDNDLVLSVINSKKEHGLLLLHSEIGNYTSRKSDYFKIEKGEKIELHCSLCQANLDSKKHENFAHVIHLSPTGHESDIFFSKIFGEKVTHHVDQEKVFSYGEHCKRYADPEWFL